MRGGPQRIGHGKQVGPSRTRRIRARLTLEIVKVREHSLPRLERHLWNKIATQVDRNKPLIIERPRTTVDPALKAVDADDQRGQALTEVTVLLRCLIRHGCLNNFRQMEYVWLDRFVDNVTQLG